MDIPWDYILGSAGGAGIVVVLVVVFSRKLLDQTIESAFKERLEKLKMDLTRDLEFAKSELNVWEVLRKDILGTMWAAHREVTKGMSSVIWRLQEILMESGYDPRRYPPVTEFRPVRKKLESTIEEYRRLLHNNIDVISPEAIDQICQHFLSKAYESYDIDSSSQSDLASEYEFALKVIHNLKGIRHKFYRYTAQLYGLEKMMPWMASESREDTTSEFRRRSNRGGDDPST